MTSQDARAGVRVRVPAKVNLHLSVGPRRADGYHELVTVFHAVDLVDEVVAVPADVLTLTVSGRATGVPADATNLAWRAAVLLAATAGLEPRVALHLDKAIPVAGGMAGGSADAAGALLACARLWDLDVDTAELGTLAARLGSDTVFPLLGGTALGTGRGEVIEPVPCPAPLHWVLATAEDGIPAGAAYAELDRQRDGAAPAGPDPATLLSALEDGDVEAVAGALHNDLQAAALALRPELRDTLDAGRDALAGIVSGSGPTCAFLCADATHAAAVDAALGAAGYATAVAGGPAAGAQVVR